jgi:hypothetical protein
MTETLTTKPVQAGSTDGAIPEFGRTNDVQRLYGIKRGTLYTLSRQGKVRSCLLRVAGQKSGVRLWHLESIRGFITKQMAEQLTEQPTAEGVAQWIAHPLKPPDLRSKLCRKQNGITPPGFDYPILYIRFPPNFCALSAGTRRRLSTSIWRKSSWVFRSWHAPKRAASKPFPAAQASGEMGVYSCVLALIFRLSP